MERTKFNELMEKTFDRLRELNSTKGVEYSGHEDVLSDFREVARAIGISPEQALMTYATKHWRAINHYAQEGATLSEPIEGRIHDLQLYMQLLLAMVEDGKPPEAIPPQGYDEHLDAQRTRSRAVRGGPTSVSVIAQREEAS